MNKTIVRIYPSKKLDFICLSVIRVGRVRKIGDKVILIDQKYLNQNQDHFYQSLIDRSKILRFTTNNNQILIILDH